MAKYLTYDGTHITYPLPGGKTGFIIQSVNLENFNDTPVIANASYFKDAPIWGHTELHLTRVWMIYKFNAANTKVALYVATGPKPIAYIAVPLLCCAVSAAGVVTRAFESEPQDIPLDPSGEVGTTSRLQFILIPITGVNAADDVAIVFQGWFRDDVPEQEETESIVDVSDRGLLESIYDLLTGKE